MIKENQKQFNRLHLLVDGLVIAFAYIFAWALKFHNTILLESEILRRLPNRIYFSTLIIVVPAYLLLYYLFDLYSPKRVRRLKREALIIVQANTVGLIIFMVVLFITKFSDFSRMMLIVFYFSNITFNVFVRTCIKKSLTLVRKKGYNLKHILLVGYSRAAEGYIDRMLANPQWGYEIKGILDDRVKAGTVYKGVKVLGSIGNLPYILPENKLDEIAITLSIEDYGMLENIVAQCEKSGVHTQFIPDYNNFIPTRPYIEDLGGLPVINIRNVPLSNTVNKAVKRLIDIFGSLAAIIIFSPVFLIITLLIKLTSKGPLIFKQERIGLHNKPFWMYKFRSMIVQDSTKEAQGWTVKNDSRVTPIGRFIRKTSIDELPQLFNVLKGDMSLIGPRPERPQFVEKFKEEIPRYMIKHQVRPGMTGWAQVNGLRGDTSIPERIRCDLYYIENWTLALDIKILFLTVFNGFVNKNAY